MSYIHKTEMIKDVYWTGVVDWAVRLFHGYHTDEGSSYNSYLIMDEHPTLIDTVKAPFAREFEERISAVCPLDKIEYVVMNHAEGDHSSALPYIIRKMPQATVVTNAKCKESLLLLYPELSEHQKWQLVDAKSKLEIGARTLSFLPVPLIHWPDSMFTYSAYDHCLFSNDGFGQHLASSERWASELPVEHVIHLAKEYNANILGHLPALLKNALKAASALDIAYILPAHGVAWNAETIPAILGEYTRFAEKRYLKKAVVFFDSMYGSTHRAALAVAEGVKSTGCAVEVLDLKSADITKVALQLYDAAGFAVGSPTLNNTVMPHIEESISYCRGLKLLEKKPFVAFGAFGWCGRACADIEEMCKRALAGECLGKVQWRFQVTDEILKQNYDLGVALGKKIAESL